MSKWFKKYRHDANARIRVFCFPYAGGSASIFDGWESSLPPWADLFALQSPGRTVRFAEKPIANLRQKVAILAEEIQPYLDVPCVFVGHSNGALVAFELGRELQRRGQTRLRHLVLSAKRAPHLPKNGPPIHDLPYPEFVAKLKELKATPAEVLENEELMQIFEPMLRADFALSDTHPFQAVPRLESAATLFWGEHDVDVPKDDVLAWREHVAGEVAFEAFDGDHFFIHHNRAEFLTRLRNIVERAVA
jgi:medium-chain acyl-[acyl-carrier-protein] hydrolase